MQQLTVSTGPIHRPAQNTYANHFHLEQWSRTCTEKINYTQRLVPTICCGMLSGDRNIYTFFYPRICGSPSPTRGTVPVPFLRFCIHVSTMSNFSMTIESSGFFYGLIASSVSKDSDLLLVIFDTIISYFVTLLDKIRYFLDAINYN